MSYALKEVSDKQLMVTYGLGDEHAFTELVRRYQTSLSSFLRLFLRQQDLVEDVFQETMLRVYVHRDHFDSQRPLKPWLFTIAANTARDTLRKSLRRPAFSIGSLNPNEDRSFGEVLDHLSSVEDNPLESLEQCELFEAVQDAIERMSPKKRDILMLAYYERLSYQEISERLSIPVGTVKSRLHSAVREFSGVWSMQNG